MPAAWYSPICDRVLTKIVMWLSRYEQGEVAASRPFMTLDGFTVDRPTLYGHKIAWKPVEMQHLVRLIEEVTPKAEYLPDLKKVQANLKHGRLLPGGEYLVTIAFYRQDLLTIYETLMKAKTGVLTVAETAAKQKDQGKDLFEL